MNRHPRLPLIALVLLAFATALSACSGGGPTPTSTAPAPTATPAPPPPPTITLENLDRLQPVASYGNGRLHRFSLQPDGTHIAVAGSSGVWLLDAQSLTVVANFEAHVGDTRTLAYSPDGTTLATGGEDSLIKLWNSADWSLKGVLRGHDGPITDLAFAPDGARLASTSEDGDVLVWDAASQTQVTRFEAHELDTQSLAWSPDGALIVSGDLQGGLFIWDAATGETAHTLNGHEGWVTDLLWLQDGRVLSSSLDRWISVWDTDSGAMLDELGNLTIVNALAYSATRDALISGGGGPFELREWQLDNGLLLREIEGLDHWLNQVDWLSDEMHYLTLTNHSRLALWDARFGEIVAEFAPDETVFGSQGNALAVSPDGRWLAAGEGSGAIQLWDTLDGSLVARLRHHSLGITALSFSPAGGTLAAASGDGRISLWDMPAGTFDRELAGFSGMLNALSWAPDGRRLAAGTTFGQIQIWNTATGQIEQTVFPDLEVESVAWMPNGVHVVSGNIAGDLQVWDLADNSLTFESNAHNGLLTTLLWAPDGEHFLSLDRNGRGIVWREDDMRMITTVVHGGQLTESAAWSPDSRLIAIGDSTGLITLFDANSGDALAMLSGSAFGVRGLAWAPDGGRLYALGMDGVSQVWQVSESLASTVVEPALPDSYTQQALVDPSAAIDAQNIDAVSLLGRLGDGTRADHALHPNGSLLAVAGGRGVWLVDHPTGTLRALLEGDAASAASWSPDGRWLAVREPFAITIWDMRTLAVAQRYATSYFPDGQLAWAPDGALLAASAPGGAITVWNTASGEVARNLRHDYQDASITALTWTGPMTVAAAISHGEHSAILFWALASGQAQSELRGPSAPIMVLVSDAATGRLIAGDESGTAWAWQLDPLQLVGSATISTDSAISAIKITDDALLLGDQSGAVHGWQAGESPREISAGDGFPISDIVDGQALMARVPLGPATLRGTASNSTLSADGAHLAVVGEDGIAAVWDLATSTQIAWLDDAGTPLTATAWSPDGQRLYATGDDGRLHVWQGDSYLHSVVGEQVEVEGVPASFDAVLAISPLTGQIAISQWDCSVLLLDPATFDPVSTLGDPNDAADRPALRAMSYSPDGTLLATVDTSGTLAIWDLERTTMVYSEGLFAASGDTLAWSPDGAWLAVSGSDGVFETEYVRLWNLEGGAVEREVPLEWVSAVGGLAWSPDGTLLAIGFADAFTGKGMLSFYDLATDTLGAPRLTGHNLPITGLDWSPDGATVISTSEDGGLALWGIP